ncbi:cardiolipin synthase [Thalassorhabdus alkalitolerans]|uniref:Cardiolipin synthase n=1 Tax=Thalassorhabdus alkalitolerans TaxID=2282697 RepID=A0ABW0YM82_9BACI
MVWVLLLLLLLFTWIRMDFLLGLRNHRHTIDTLRFPKRQGRVQFMDDGKEFFTSYVKDIEESVDHIHILFYIFRGDSIGSKIIELLTEKAKAGIEVRVMADRLGSHLSKKDVKKLKAAGVQFAYTRKITPPYLFFTFNRRNHRKITIIDGKTGYLGGFNVGDEYLGRKKKFGFWRDFQLRISGDGVQDLQTQFFADWKESQQTIPASKDRYYPVLQQGPHPLRFMPTNGLGLEKKFIQVINQADSYIYIGSPYFIPGKPLQKALITAARRGVEVSILLPKKSDHPLVKEASYPYFKDMMEAGINIFHYPKGFYHAKAMVIDDHFCDVGTANFDKRSFHLNNEINCLLLHPDIISVVKETLSSDMKKSEQLTWESYRRRSVFHRSKERVSTWISELL